MMKIQRSEFKQRRERLMKKMGKKSIAIIPAAPEVFRNHDAHYAYRQNSHFHYLTGFPEPAAIAVIIPDRAEGRYLLFNRPRDKAQELWVGERAGQTGALKEYDADEAYPIDQFEALLPSLLENCDTIY